MTHHKQALRALDQAIAAQQPADATTFASISTAHGILALHDLLQSEISVGDEPEPPNLIMNTIRELEQENRTLQNSRERLIDDIANLRTETRELESQLQGARQVIRQQEQTMTADRQDYNALYEQMVRVKQLAIKWEHDNGGTLQAYAKKIREALDGTATNSETADTTLIQPITNP